MSLEKANIRFVFAHFGCAVLVCAVLLQSLPQAIVFFTDSGFELKLTQYDGEKESEQEEDNKDKKIEMLVLSPYHHRFSFAGENFTLDILEPHGDFSMEIPIPPPERL